MGEQQQLIHIQLTLLKDGYDLIIDPKDLVAKFRLGEDCPNPEDIMKRILLAINNILSDYPDALRRGEDKNGENKGT